MLKTYLRQLLEEYAGEIDLVNAAELVRMDVDDLLEEILEEKTEEILYFYYAWMLSMG